eukprot:2229406-Karenia_brevis.AAC.1
MQWRSYEQQNKQSMRFEHWVLEQTLPCRCCTDENNGEEVWKPTTAFHVSTDPTELGKRFSREGKTLHA